MRRIKLVLIGFFVLAEKVIGTLGKFGFQELILSLISNEMYSVWDTAPKRI